jgi:hypothetical protein
MSDSYRPVTVTLRQRRANAIMVEVPRKQGWQTIPRSLLHASDDLKFDRGEHQVDTEITIRIRDWKAEELGLA